MPPRLIATALITLTTLCCTNLENIYLLHLHRSNQLIFYHAFSFIKGDVKFAEVLEKMGAKVTWSETSVTVTGPPRDSSKKKHLRAIDVNMNKMPDVAMTLAVVALFADGPTAIRDGMLAFLLCRKK